MVHWPNDIQRQGSELMIDSQKFTGDLSSLWKLQKFPPIHHLTWDWWWWLVMLDDEEGNPAWKTIDGFVVYKRQSISRGQRTSMETGWQTWI
ncbi:MAG: hypothetical protein CM15mP9_1200 [Methanobacteriota archaeon]|nr:MAG: hypothetical protein CM15mP9_1200 [Euryarchaeota archaeon]